MLIEEMVLRAETCTEEEAAELWKELHSKIVIWDALRVTRTALGLPLEDLDETAASLARVTMRLLFGVVGPGSRLWKPNTPMQYALSSMVSVLLHLWTRCNWRNRYSSERAEVRRVMGKA